MEARTLKASLEREVKGGSVVVFSACGGDVWGTARPHDDGRWSYGYGCFDQGGGGPWSQFATRAAAEDFVIGELRRVLLIQGQSPCNSPSRSKALDSAARKLADLIDSRQAGDLFTEAE